MVDGRHRPVAQPAETLGLVLPRDLREGLDQRLAVQGAVMHQPAVGQARMTGHDGLVGGILRGREYPGELAVGLGDDQRSVPEPVAVVGEELAGVQDGPVGRPCDQVIPGRGVVRAVGPGEAGPGRRLARPGTRGRRAAAGQPRRGYQAPRSAGPWSSPPLGSPPRVQPRTQAGTVATGSVEWQSPPKEMECQPGKDYAPLSTSVTVSAIRAARCPLAGPAGRTVSRGGQWRHRCGRTASLADPGRVS